MTTPIDDLSVVYVDTSGITLDPYPKEQGTWYKGDDYLVVVRPSFISFWIRRTSRRYDIQGGTLQDEIAAFCAMTGEPLDDAGFRAYHRRADAAYFTRGTVDERDDRDERQGMVGHIVERPT